VDGVFQMRAGAHVGEDEPEASLGGQKGGQKEDKRCQEPIRQ
jgi:hypothetical protein